MRSGNPMNHQHAKNKIALRWKCKCLNVFFDGRKRGISLRRILRAQGLISVPEVLPIDHKTLTRIEILHGITRFTKLRIWINLNWHHQHFCLYSICVKLHRMSICVKLHRMRI